MMVSVIIWVTSQKYLFTDRRFHDFFKYTFLNTSRASILYTIVHVVSTTQKRAQAFEIGYSKIQKIKEISDLTLFCVIHY